MNAQRTGDNATPLHLACGFGNVAGSGALLAAGADANAACKQGSRPLHWAARSSPGCVRALLEHGADPSQLCNDGSVGGWTPLMLSAGSGQAKSVALLLGAGAAVDAARGDGVTALMLAAGSGCHECVGHLLVAGASPFRRDLRGDSALHHAARAGCEDCVQALLGAGADPSSANRAGETAQQVASAAGAPGAAMLLWEAAAQAAAAAEAAAQAAAAAAALELERQRAEEASKPIITLTRVQSAPILGLVRRTLSAVPGALVQARGAARVREWPPAAATPCICADTARASEGSWGLQDSQYRAHLRHRLAAAHATPFSRPPPIYPALPQRTRPWRTLTWTTAPRRWTLGPSHARRWALPASAGVQGSVEGVGAHGKGAVCLMVQPSCKQRWR